MSRASYAVLAIAGVLAAGAPAFAQAPVQTPAKPAPQDETTVSEVISTGYRASLQNALETKRNSDVMVDAINAEDIADFPDSNLAESLQRLPGVSIDRFDGEGRSITVRGLGGDFTRTRLNGLEALSTAGANESGGTVGINRSRSFDYNTFASELFNSLKVQKTASAETDEGSLGATVDLTVGRPFNFKGARAALTVQDAYFQSGGTHNPRVAALFSQRWMDGKLGALVSYAYSKRDQTIDSYSRQPAAFDYAYRGSTFAGTPNPTAGIPVVIQRQGFAAPTTAVCNGSPAGPTSNGVVPGLNITYQPACDTQRGSNPAAYALLYPVIGAQRTRDATSGVITTTSPGSLIRIPGLPTLNQQQINQERQGVTYSFQARPQDSTLISFDGVYSKMKYDSQLFQVSTIGTNRNNTVSGFNTLSNATSTATKQGFYTNISCRSAITGFTADCQGTQGSATVLPGYAISRNPYNLEAYDYYNNPLSVGYIAPPPGGITGIAQLDKLIGRPSTRIIDAALSPGGMNADYLKLGNLDVRSADDESRYTTIFKQWSLNLEQDLGQTWHMTGLYGQSTSRNAGQGLLTDYIRLDSGQGVPGNDYYVFDERGDVKMPVFNLGFDAADPANWDTVKGYSVLRTFARNVNNKYENGRLDFAWDGWNDNVVKFGVSTRTYTFDTTESRRAIQETANPTLLEAGSTVAATSRLITWGQGLDVPAGTTTSFIAPDNRKMEALFGFNCDCINKYGDFRKTILQSPGSNFGVTEKDASFYGQLDFDSEVYARRIRGNIGIRWARTKVDAEGLTTFAPFAPITNSNLYEDTLPSANLVYEVTDNILVRFGASKVMARPSLALLAPGFSAISIPTEIGATSGASLSAGNTKLNPIRATNFDLAVEWYPTRDSTFGVALFDKEISNYQQIVLSSVKLSSILTPAQIAALRATQTLATATAYIDGDYDFDLKQARDTPGGYVRGIEINYLQNLTFLPGFLKNFGVQANYTHIQSQLQYLIDPGQPQIKNVAGVITQVARPEVYAGGPYLNASPDAVNFTLFYETPVWSARVSTAWRAEYFTNYPVATGTCDPGYCDSPLINDFQGSRATTNIDASFSYKLNNRITLTVEGLNLTNQTDNRFAYVNDPVVTRYASSGRQFFMGLRAAF